LDSLDVRILRELAQAQTILPGRPGLGPSFREIARKLAAPPATIRYRIKQMYSEGVITGSSVVPNPSLLGMKAGAFNVDVPPFQDKQEVVRRLAAVEGVGYLHNLIGSMVWVVFFYEDDQALTEKLRTMEEIAGTQGLFSHIPYPPCTGSLTQAEAALMLRLVERGFDSYGSMARELGASVRTLERRISKLVGENAVTSLPTVNYHKMSGCVPADLVIFFTDIEEGRASPARLLPLIGDSLILAALWDVVGMCSLVLPSVDAASDLAERVRKVQGVTKARVEIVKDHVDQASRMAIFVKRWMAKNEFKVTPIPVSKPQG
jgi:DNA-binding Lrp family transcriptional regulator